jgi:hypothetical protein
VGSADALRRWLRSNVEFVATKKGMSAALALAVHGSSDLAAFTFDRLMDRAPEPSGRYHARRRFSPRSRSILISVKYASPVLLAHSRRAA